jgi:uncharacterized protein YjbI with pentapeptide repeats
VKATRGRGGLLAVAAVLIVAAVLPWADLVRLAGAIDPLRLALAGAALACVIVALTVFARPRGRALATAPRPLRPISWWWMLAAAGIVVAISWGVTAWMLAEASHVTPDGERAKARIDAVRTGLATGGGIGAAAALLLAFRRQHHAEATAASIDYDASEKRITELYTNAVEQLGSDRAPVRLGGLYALERLAQGNPDHRQVVVDVLCAYLRMPYTPPDEDAAPIGPPPGEPATTADPREEQQVRLTAQRILAAHLRDPTRPQAWADQAAAHREFWDQVKLDLTGATLISPDFTHCHLGEVNFYGATFVGVAWFNGSIFGGPAWFNRATFTGEATFSWTACRGELAFGEATFLGDASFEGTGVAGDVTFAGATFHGDARFGLASFSGDTAFDRAVFHRAARFRDVTFDGDATFVEAVFAGDADFDLAEFDGRTRFSVAEFHRAATFHEATFGGGTSFEGAMFTMGTGSADLRGARACIVQEAHAWPAGWATAAQDGSAAGGDRDFRALVRSTAAWAGSD